MGKISPGPEFQPLAYRLSDHGLTYFEDPYIIIDAHETYASITSWLSFGRTYHYGTYKWRGKAQGAANYCSIFLGLFEYHHGRMNDGGIFIYWNNTEWLITTKWAGVTKDTIITGVDFTVEHEFKLEWTKNRIRLWIDGVLKATHTTGIPQKPMQLFNEVIQAACPAGTATYIFFRNQSFRKIPNE